MEPIIEIKNLTHIYSPNTPFEQRALDQVNLTIYRGEYLGIIGRTGSGKSTLIQHLNGLIRPTEGEVLFQGQDIWSSKELTHNIRFQVGLVFQYPEYQLFEETVYKDIAFGPLNMGLSEEEVNRRVLRAAKFCGLGAAMLSQSPFELSGGQKRRAAIAGVLAMEPKLLVLDEPAAGLDPEGRDTILSQVKQFHQETGTTVVLVSHSMEDIAKYADKVLVLDAGHVAMYDTTSAVFARADELLQLGLSVPEVTKVFLRLREWGLDVPADVYTVPYAANILRGMLEKGAGTC